MENEGKKVMYIRSYKTENGKMKSVELIEKYNELFKNELSDKTDSKEFLKIFFQLKIYLILVLHLQRKAKCKYYGCCTGYAR